MLTSCRVQLLFLVCLTLTAGQAVAQELATPVRLSAIADALIDEASPSSNFSDWSTTRGEPLLSLDATKTVLLRWDFSQVDTSGIVGTGHLEVYTYSLFGLPDNSGLLQIFEIQPSAPAWTDSTITYTSFAAETPLRQSLVLITRSEIAQESLVRTIVPIPNDVLVRLQTGQSQGLALQAQGPVLPSFYSRRAYGGLYAARLAFTISN